MAGRVSILYLRGTMNVFKGFRFRMGRHFPPSLGSEEESGTETRKKPLRTWNHRPLLEKPCELFPKEARKFRK